LPELEGGFRLNAFWGQVFNAPLLWAGLGAYAIEFFVWLEALSRAPLSLVVSGGGRWLTAGWCWRASWCWGNRQRRRWMARW